MGKPSSIGKSDALRVGGIRVETTTTQKAEMFDNRRDNDWLNPISMSNLKSAVKAKRETVVLNGDEYSITYEIKYKGRTLGDSYDLIFLKRTDGAFAPCGYISVKKILDFDFEKGRE